MNEFANKILGIPTVFAQTEKVSSVASGTADQIQNLINSVIVAFPLWITGFLVIIISFFLSRLVKNAVENKMTAAGLEEEHREIQIVSGRAASAIVITLGVTVGLKIAGIDLTAIIAAAAFGVGFAMQDIIMNFLAGIIVLLQKQFTIGDWIVVKGTAGIVKEIQSRYTVIKKFDGTKVIIPNSELFKNQVKSLTGYPFRRFQIDIGVDLYYDLKETINLIYASIAKVPKILVSPKPSIIVTQPGAFYNNLRIRCWVDSKKGILRPISELMRQIHKDFYSRGWAWPYPTQNLIFDKDVPPTVAERADIYVKNHLQTASPAAVPAVSATEAAPGTATPAQNIVAQQVNPPLVFKKVDAGPDTERINIPALTAMPASTPPAPAVESPPPVTTQQIAPPWLQNVAAAAEQTGIPKTPQTGESQANPSDSQIPMGVPVQPQNPPTEPVKVEIPMGAAPQPIPETIPDQATSNQPPVPPAA